MNKLTIIGNLTRNPETAVTPNGKELAQFSVAVNGRNNESTFFRVTAWGKLGEICKQYLAKGSKVAVVGSVGVHAYKDKGGEAAASLDVTASDVEFLGGKGARSDAAEPEEPIAVPAPDDLPF